MAKSWTPEQLSAIETTDKTLLVSAAAGSGKTATLTERIIRTLLDEEKGADVSSMLIVTYTRAAASELRERISSALDTACEQNPENVRLRRQQLCLPSAKICTIDSYCSELVRQNAHKLGIKGDFRVCEENERALLCREVMEALIEQCYAESDFISLSSEEFCEFADTVVSAKQGEELAPSLLGIYSKLTSLRERTDRLRVFADELSTPCDFLSTRMGGFIKEDIRECLEHYQRVYEDYIVEITSSGEEKIIKNHLPAFDKELSYIRSTLSSLDDSTYSALRERIQKGAKVQLGAVKGVALDADTRLKKARDAFFKRIEEYKKNYFSYSEDELDLIRRKAFSFSSVLHRLLSEFDHRFCEEKRRRGICDLSDLEHYALELLYDGEELSDLARSLRESFKYVYIDEYQDVNSVQHAIFSAISREDNCFMVGDIKQSIYSFRHAEPDIFAEMKKSFPHLTPDHASPKASIFMSNNFRCDKTVVELVNAIFDRVFSVVGGSIGYESDDALRFSKLCEDNYSGVLPEIIMIEKPSKSASVDDEDTDEGEDEVSESEYVARKIKSLLDGGTLADGSPIKPSDIAILLRSAKTKAQVYATALAKYGIECDASEQGSFFESPEVLLVLCILNTIDNPQKDIYLAGALHSPVYSFTLDELIAIRRSVREKTSLFDALCIYCEENPDFDKGQAFLDELAKFRLKARGCPVDKLIEYIYNETGLLSLYGESSEAGHARLLSLYNHARTFEASSFRGLYNFVQYVNEIIDHERTFDEPKRSTGNGVQIMTVHHSKGLEFPVCFVCDCSYGLTPQDLKNDMIFDAKMGVSVRYLYDDGLKADNPIRFAMSRNVYKNAILEELRVLYVALTRARERLFITGKLPKKTLDFIEECEENSRFMSDYSVSNMKTYMKIVLSSVLLKNEDCARILFVDENGNERTLREVLDSAGVAELDIDAPDAFEESTPDALEESAPDEPAQATDGQGETVPECDQNGDTLEFVEMIKQRFGYVYPHEHMTAIPVKLSVSRLYPDVLDEGQAEPLELVPVDEREEGDKVIEPRFISHEDTDDASKRGIATHLFMQFADFEALKEKGAMTELSSLVSRGFITEHDAQIVYRDELCLFERSDFLLELLSAKQLRRELRFNSLLDASDFTLDDELKKSLAGEKLLVQGVIDCVIEKENGEYIIVDYKTDRLSDFERAHPEKAREKLLSRHRRQLEYYSLACEKIYGKKPERVLIYSLPLGKAIAL